MLLKDRFAIDSTGDEERSRVISYGPCQVIFKVQNHQGIRYFYDAVFDIFFCFNCSFLHLALLWRDTGRSRHMNQRSFGQSTVLTNHQKALPPLIGCTFTNFMPLLFPGLLSLNVALM